MNHNNENEPVEAEWNEEAKAAFMAFKKKKRNLPSPGDVDRSADALKKPRKFNYSNNRLSNRINNRQLMRDQNRALNSENNDSFSSRDNNIKSSTFSERFMSMDETELDSDKTEVACDETNKNIAQVREMIARKDDPYIILDKIVQQMAETHKTYQDKFAKVAADSQRYAARHNEQLINLENHVMREISKVRQYSEDRLNAIEFSQKCLAQNNVVWLSFADPAEIEDLRTKSKAEMIREAIKVLTRLDIWNKASNRTIVDAFTQKISIKTDQGFENELIMGIKFMNSFAARDVKRLAAQYTKSQFISKNFDSIRYIVRDNWSAEVWKLLRVCYELNRIKLIERAIVSDIGIQVFYKKKIADQNCEQDADFKALIRVESDLDELRVDVKDVALNVPTSQLYDGNYFKMSYNARDSYRISVNSANIPASDATQEAGPATA